MTENEKICPIMSQPVAVPHQSGIVMHYELCLKERCTAWVPEQVEHIPGDDRARTIKYPARRGDWIEFINFEDVI
jgi:hypothetical protein